MNDNAPKDFESTIKDLEGVVVRLESGDLTLEQQLQEYEKGVNLATECTKMLENAKLRLEKLSSQDSKENE